MPQIARTKMRRELRSVPRLLQHVERAVGDHLEVVGEQLAADVQPLRREVERVAAVDRHAVRRVEAGVDDERRAVGGRLGLLRAERGERRRRPRQYEWKPKCSKTISSSVSWIALGVSGASESSRLVLRRRDLQHLGPNARAHTSARVSQLTRTPRSSERPVLQRREVLRLRPGRDDRCAPSSTSPSCSSSPRVRRRAECHAQRVAAVVDDDGVARGAWAWLAVRKAESRRELREAVRRELARRGLARSRDEERPRAPCRQVHSQNSYTRSENAHSIVRLQRVARPTAALLPRHDRPALRRRHTFSRVALFT